MQFLLKIVANGGNINVRRSISVCDVDKGTEMCQVVVRFLFWWKKLGKFMIEAGCSIIAEKFLHVSFRLILSFTVPRRKTVLGAAGLGIGKR